MDSQNSAPETPAFKALPEKLFFRIGDVAEILGVKAYVLRYWETEFPMVQPTKSQAGHRVYRRQDVEMLQLIQHLLYAERYSIEGARRRIRELKKAGELKSFREAAEANLETAAAPQSSSVAVKSSESAAPSESLATSIAMIAESAERTERIARALKLAHELQTLSRIASEEFFASDRTAAGISSSSEAPRTQSSARAPSPTA